LVRGSWFLVLGLTRAGGLIGRRKRHWLLLICYLKCVHCLRIHDSAAERRHKKIALARKFRRYAAFKFCGCLTRGLAGTLQPRLLKEFRHSVAENFSRAD